MIADDPNSRVACETLLTTGLVVVAGEVTTKGYAPIAALVREKIVEIGYDDGEKGFDGRALRRQVAIGQQSPRHRPGRRQAATRPGSVTPATSSTTRVPATRA